MWSFGCFMFEMLAYLHGGLQAVSGIYIGRRKRQGSLWAHYFHTGDSVHPIVTQFLQSINAQDPENESFHSLSDIINAALQIEPERRLNAGLMTRGLFHLAQRNRFQMICLLLDNRQELRDFELEMEHLRLKIWAEAAGLAYKWNEMPNTAWLAISRNYEELKKVHDGLKKCHKEIKSVIDDLATNESFANHRYYHLQRSQDDLWDMQPATIRSSMMSRLEDMVLCAGDHALFSDSNISLGEQVSRQNKLQSGIGTDGVPRSPYRRIVLLAIMKQIASAVTQQKHPDQDLLLDKDLLSSLLRHITAISWPAWRVVIAEF